MNESAARAAGADRGVRAPADLLARSLRMFAAPSRARRATDLVLLIPALAGPLLGTAAYPPSSLEASLERFLAAIPTFLDPDWGFGALRWPLRNRYL